MEVQPDIEGTNPMDFVPTCPLPQEFTAQHALDALVREAEETLLQRRAPSVTKRKQPDSSLRKPDTLQVRFHV